MKLYDMMSKDVQSIKTSDSVKKAARLMKDHDIGILPVLNDDGEIVGALTDRDIACRVVADGTNPDTAHVGDFMSKHIKTCDKNQTIEDAANCMKSQKLQRVFVVSGDKSKLAGVVSMQDIVKAAPDKKLVHDTLDAIYAS